MTEDVKLGLGRVEHVDERDKLFPLSATLPEKPFIDSKMWWDNGWWGDQGSTSYCTVFSWSHWMEDGPLIQQEFIDHAKPPFDPNKLYFAFQENDGIPGTGYAGSTVRAGAKVLKKLGVVSEYRWAASTDEMVTCLLTIGPMVVGTKWYSNMFNPDQRGYIKVGGSPAGGHAYLINGVDTVKGIFRIKNSWGKKWGDNGHAYISIEDFAKLLADGGEACMAVANRLTTMPDVESIVADDVGNG